jgi:hypothetical protein
MVRRSRLLAVGSVLGTALGCSQGGHMARAPAIARAEAPVTTTAVAPAQSPDVKTPAATQQCPAFEDVPLLESYWFSVVRSVEVLNELIRADAPSAAAPIADITQRSGSFRAPEADWHFMTVAGRIVATRQVTTPLSNEYDLTTQVFGNVVIGMLKKRDYRCPVKRTDDCYPDEDGPVQEATPRQLCESDLSVPCDEEGSRLTIEVLDAEKGKLRRLDDLRRVGDVRVGVIDRKLRVDIDDCSLYP